jgi:hypothetical protein
MNYQLLLALLAISRLSAEWQADRHRTAMFGPRLRQDEHRRFPLLRAVASRLLRKERTGDVD